MNFMSYFCVSYFIVSQHIIGDSFNKQSDFESSVGTPSSADVDTIYYIIIFVNFCNFFILIFVRNHCVTFLILYSNKK